MDKDKHFNEAESEKVPRLPRIGADIPWLANLLETLKTLDQAKDRLNAYLKNAGGHASGLRAEAEASFNRLTFYISKEIADLALDYAAQKRLLTKEGKEALNTPSKVTLREV